MKKDRSGDCVFCQNWYTQKHSGFYMCRKYKGEVSSRCLEMCKKNKWFKEAKDER